MRPRADLHSLRSWVLAAAALLASFGWSAARADIAYQQAPDPAGNQYKSAWLAPDGFDDDEYVWDNFTLAANTGITEVRWGPAGEVLLDEGPEDDDHAPRS